MLYVVQCKKIYTIINIYNNACKKKKNLMIRNNCDKKKHKVHTKITNLIIPLCRKISVLLALPNT